MDSTLLVLLISTIFAIFDQTSTSCIKKFNDINCKCGNEKYDSDEEVFVVNCTDSNLTSPDILRELPVDTEVLIFVGNRLKELPKNLFGKYATFDKLRVVDLSRNHIKKIEEGAFSKRESSIEKLILNENKWRPEKGVKVFENLEKLTELHLVNGLDSSENRFELISDLITSSDFNKLTVLNLSHNFIKEFQDDSFMCFLPNLRKLDLSRNRLSSIDITHRCAKQLLLLDLSHNRFSVLDPTTRATFDNLEDIQIRLNANPFQCDCNFKDTSLWLHNSPTDFLDTETYHCADAIPDDLVGKLIYDVKWDELRCPGSYTNVGLIVMAVILVIVLAIVIGLIYINRQQVQGCLRRSTDPIWRKFEYSTISSKRGDEEVDV